MSISIVPHQVCRFTLIAVVCSFPIHSFAQFGGTGGQTGGTGTTGGMTSGLGNSMTMGGQNRSITANSSMFGGFGATNATGFSGLTGGTGGRTGTGMTGMGGTGMGGTGMGGMGMGGMGLGGMGLGGMGMGGMGLGGMGLGGMGGLGGMNMFGRNNLNSNAQNQRQVRARMTIGFTPDAVAPEIMSTNISTKLKRLPLPIQSRGIGVTMEGRTAVMTGTVANEAEANKLARLLKLEPGVDDVRSELTYSEAETVTGLPVN